MRGVRDSGLSPSGVSEDRRKHKIYTGAQAAVLMAAEMEHKMCGRAWQVPRRVT